MPGPAHTPRRALCLSAWRRARHVKQRVSRFDATMLHLGTSGAAIAPTQGKTCTHPPPLAPSPACALRSEALAVCVLRRPPANGHRDRASPRPRARQQVRTSQDVHVCSVCAQDVTLSPLHTGTPPPRQRAQSLQALATVMPSVRTCRQPLALCPLFITRYDHL